MELPESVLELRRKYRALDATAPIPPRQRPEIDDAIRVWARDLVESGELSRLIDEVAATDPELATQ